MKFDINGVAVNIGSGDKYCLNRIIRAANEEIQKNIPIIPISYLESKIFSNFIGNTQISFPFVSLLADYHDTQIILTKGIGQHEILAFSVDIGIGELFDSFYR